jgi:hypothetical protein
MSSQWGKMIVDDWFAAHSAYHKASDAYNERLKLVRSERERGNWTMRSDQEADALNRARTAALDADSKLYEALQRS